ncbi:hypothetical protein CFOL_v3_15103 [Cephalotus follicularis]|uniref:Uncharacterized protein n=1 Tax=Cephalotus follicularis TaxID=3775 RepID=A0A1Q3BV06_CEPFO|nr:hypothetical protein CFOL_v3_15103 [Cephalotus follicularis]
MQVPKMQYYIHPNDFVLLNGQSIYSERSIFSKCKELTTPGKIISVVTETSGYYSGSNYLFVGLCCLRVYKFIHFAIRRYLLLISFICIGLMLFEVGYCVISGILQLCGLISSWSPFR